MKKDLELAFDNIASIAEIVLDSLEGTVILEKDKMIEKVVEILDIANNNN